RDRRSHPAARAHARRPHRGQRERRCHGPDPARRRGQPQRAAHPRPVRRHRRSGDRPRGFVEPGPDRLDQRQGCRLRPRRTDRPPAHRASPCPGGAVTAREGRPGIAVWLGSAAPVRSIRWLDGALKTAAKFPGAIAVAAGEDAWLDLAADRAARVGLASVGVVTDLELDYLGWAQVMASAARKLGATTILVDEASRPERFAEVAAIAELADAAQL